MTNPVQAPQNSDSRAAVQYLHLNQDERASEIPIQRPIVNVPIDLGYSMHRFIDSHTHVEDRMLRPLQYFANSTPLTEAQSRARMAAILAAAANTLTPTRD
ncbi:hypothetical protein F5Y09DRAFT_299370 [Xylaria sp. FL1042]|nr:hypothetical protein F5Y09DRAFT_299370 [Xylaria sp. FL1042]